jgi:hypothetical protein
MITQSFRFHYKIIFEPRHDKTIIVRLRPALIQTSLRHDKFCSRTKILLHVEKLIALCLFCHGAV